MKKRAFALIMALVMFIMSITCFAVSVSDINTADALNELGLFLGTGNGYELENCLTRAQGVTLLVRMLGMEEVAENNVYNNSFTDIPDWAAGYIGCAFENRLTNGTSETTFSPDETMTDYMFLTLVLRALNYSDKGETPLFGWNDPYALSHELNLIETDEPDTDFTRADAIAVFWNALDVELYGSEVTLAQRLIEQGVFTSKELAEARKIRKDGRKENTGVPVIFIPDTDEPETEAPETEVPETEVPETEVPETEVPETEVPETDPELGNDEAGSEGLPEEGENGTVWG